MRHLLSAPFQSFVFFLISLGNQSREPSQLGFPCRERSPWLDALICNSAGALQRHRNDRDANCDALARTLLWLLFPLVPSSDTRNTSILDYTAITPQLPSSILPGSNAPDLKREKRLLFRSFIQTHGAQPSIR